MILIYVEYSSIRYFLSRTSYTVGPPYNVPPSKVFFLIKIKNYPLITSGGLPPTPSTDRISASSGSEKQLKPFLANMSVTCPNYSKCYDYGIFLWKSSEQKMGLKTQSEADNMSNLLSKQVSIDHTLCNECRRKSNVKKTQVEYTDEPNY